MDCLIQSASQLSRWVNLLPSLVNYAVHYIATRAPEAKRGYKVATFAIWLMDFP